MARLCTKCGEALIGTGRFCASCGTPAQGVALEGNAHTLRQLKTAPPVEPVPATRASSAGPPPPPATSSYGPPPPAANPPPPHAAGSYAPAPLPFATPPPGAAYPSHPPYAPAQGYVPTPAPYASYPPPVPPPPPYAPAFVAGARVLVLWADGNRYPGIVHQVASGHCFVLFPDGQQRWVELQYLSLAR
jgi:hypothetical protein